MRAGQGGVNVELALQGLVGSMSVEAVEGVERVSHPFRYRVDFHAAHLDMDRARGRAARLCISEPHAGERYVHGVVEEVTARMTRWDHHAYSVVVVPEPFLLSYRHGFEVFQDLDVRGICERVFERAGLSRDGFEWRLSGRYPIREMCVQYDESEWAFVSRLLEAEGIWYRFQHDADGTVMVLGDDSRAAPRARPEPLSFELRTSDLEATRAHGVEQEWRLVEGQVELDDYDGFRPSRDLRARAEAGGEREWFELPGGYATEADGARLAAVRLAERQWPRRTSVFQTTALVTTAGTRVTVAGAPLATDDGLIVANELTIRAPTATADGAPQEAWEVTNRLEVIAEDQVFRPRRKTPRPRITGPQTARVVGPADQEVWVDEHGRVKLQFHWDRRGQLDEHASTWVPVAHGHVTGAMMLPRIGWEVVVEFRYGDPDRPVVTGRVYNPFFPPPHALPERCTVTSFGTDTLPGRERVNELRFEDRAGDEHVALTAARDLREHTVLHRQVTVRHDENREVGAARSEVVGVLRGLRVDRSYGQSVGRAHEVSVGNDRHETVVGNVSEQVGGDLTLHVANLYLAQVGTGVPGALFSALREPEMSPADTVLEAVIDLMQPGRDALSNASELAPSPVWSDAPSAQPVLGPALGAMTAPPTAAPSAQPSSSGPSDLEPDGPAADSSALGSAVASADTAEATSGWEANPSRRLDEADGGMDLDGASGAGSDALEDVLPFAARLAEVGASARHATARAAEVAAVVSRVKKAASEARGLGGDASGLALLDGASGIVAATSTSEISLPTGVASTNPLAFVSGLLRPESSRWDAIRSAVGDIDATLQGIEAAAHIFDAPVGEQPEPTSHRASWRHPFEREATHFAATVAAALIRGDVRDERDGGHDDLVSPDEQADTAGDEPDGPRSDHAEEDPGPRDTEPPGIEPQDAEPHDTEPQDGAGNQPQGSGAWTVRVGGDTTENIAGAVVMATAGDLRIAVGGEASETERAARYEQIGESRAEVVHGDKTESTGPYVLSASEGIELSSDDTLRIAVEGDATSVVGGARTLTAASRVEVRGGSLAMNATETITFECGAARVSISADGISIEGNQITIRADDIGVDSPALG